MTGRNRRNKSQTPFSSGNTLYISDYFNLQNGNKLQPHNNGFNFHIAWVIL